MKINHLMLLMVFALLAACSNDDDGIPACSIEIEQGTRFFEFVHEGTGKIFYAWTTDTTVINQVLAQLAIPVDQRGQHINGKILELPAGCVLNDQWSWYFDPTDWALADASIELCDGEPDFVEANLDEYVRTGRYCPWGSKVNKEVEQPF